MHSRELTNASPMRSPGATSLLFIIASLLDAVNSQSTNGWCSIGIIAGDSCCAGLCGACGGKGCGSLPGGKDLCCFKRFKRSCTGPDDEACIIPQEGDAASETPTAPKEDSAPPQLKGLSWLMQFQKNFKSKHEKPPAAEKAQEKEVNEDETSPSSSFVKQPEANEEEEAPKNEKKKKKKKKKKKTDDKTTTLDTAGPSVPRNKKSREVCKLTDLGAVLRDIQSEFRDSRTALERIRASLGFIPDAYDQAWRSPHDSPIWGARSMWAPGDCGIAEDTLKPSGCNRMCDRTVATYPSDGAYPYGASKPVTVGKVRTCEDPLDMPVAAKTAAAVPGYSCIDKFPVMTFTGQGCTDDVTGVHIAPTLSKNRPLMFAFDGVNHESGVVMPFNFKHQFKLPRFYMNQLHNSEDGSLPETRWEAKKDGVRLLIPYYS